MINYYLNKFVNNAVVFTIVLFGTVLADPTDGCELGDNQLFLTTDGSVLYNSTTDIYNFSFYIEGANLVVEPDLEGFNISTNQQGTYISANAITFQPISAGCGTLLTLDLTNIQDIYLKNINVNSECFNYYSFGTHG